MEEIIIYQFPNPQNNEWINKYNEKVREIKSQEEINKEKRRQQSKRDEGTYTAEHIGIHHILPKSINPEYKKDKNNFLYVSFKDHMDLHYYLWKADPKYARQLWFGCVGNEKWIMEFTWRTRGI